jgi:hypothetical protein
MAAAYALFTIFGLANWTQKVPVAPKSQKTADFDPDDALMISPHGPPITWKK